MKRGMTLIEVLVSLTLLAALVSAAATWTTIAGHAMGSHIAPSRWRTAAQALLTRVHDDLVIGDFESEARRSQKESLQHVSVENGALSISTRLSRAERIAERRHYQFDAPNQKVKCFENLSDSRDGRILLSDVDAFVCEIDEKRARLTVTIVSHCFGTQRRSYSLR